MSDAAPGPAVRTVDLDGPVHVLDRPGPAPDAPVAVLVHGLGASHVSWLPLVDRLAATHRVLAPDLVGFGHSAPEGRDATVEGNRDVLARLLRQEVPQGGSLLVGNSMGGMVAAMAAAAHPHLVGTLVLVDPALPGTVDLRALTAVDPRTVAVLLLSGVPVLGERLLRARRARTTPQEQVAQLLDSVCADAGRVDPAVVDLLVASATARRRYDWADGAFIQAQRSIMRHLTTGRSRYLDLLAGLAHPALLVHGDRDRLVDVRAARRLAAHIPAMRYVELPGVGHAPQLEVPDRLAEAIRDWSYEVQPHRW